ncbi:uncharacterized protein CANTADRAFT_143605 [Suhomyces tanzawaensis NRRL Y-17324]|uniref:Uncharacterized protein n=1 Tax=Suhomyces tanzawaensis NRRL Y-17324 TaxID=984487 RepID=A0A1E4SSA8_9ASCO|nr:uncharacterized protein CANTADRAFT_143605 [Suhomyces tanzawaensis NRRL Y-17324]ODV82400.1 hypothetical protein CANTADRAFT_143605 [Suhomyces tanzawaensis NRRL Y-17324]
MQQVNNTQETTYNPIQSGFPRLFADRKEFWKIAKAPMPGFMAPKKDDDDVTNSEFVENALSDDDDDFYNYDINMELLLREGMEILSEDDLEQDLQDAKMAAGDLIPRYQPLPQEQIRAFEVFSAAYVRNKNSKTLEPANAPTKPQFPKAKTNTNLATYYHKQHIYGQYMLKFKESSSSSGSSSTPSIDEKVGGVQVKCPSITITRPEEEPSSSESTSNYSYTTTPSGAKIVLKHRYDPLLGKAIARAILRRSGRDVSNLHPSTLLP